MFKQLKRQMHPLSSGAGSAQATREISLTPPWQSASRPTEAVASQALNPPPPPPTRNLRNSWWPYLMAEMGFGLAASHPQGTANSNTFELAFSARLGIRRALNASWDVRVNAGYQYSRQSFRTADDPIALTYTDEHFRSQFFIAQAQAVFKIDPAFSFSLGLAAAVGSFEAERESNDFTVTPAGTEIFASGLGGQVGLPLQLELGTRSLRASVCATPDFNWYANVGVNVGFRLGFGLSIFIH